jgi:hypothetical protein
MTTLSSLTVNQFGIPVVPLSSCSFSKQLPERHARRYVWNVLACLGSMPDTPYSFARLR